MKLRALWINADDFGMSDGVCEGIAECLDAEQITTTTLMPCIPGSLERAAKYAERFAGRMGVHLQLTDGVPVLPASAIPGLVTADGQFPRKAAQLGALDSEQIFCEWSAQVAAVRAVGIEPSHLDSHHDVHWRPAALRAYIRLARNERLPVRGGPSWLVQELRSAEVACAAAYHTLVSSGEPNMAEVCRQLHNLSGGLAHEQVVELGVHPARIDAMLIQRSSYIEQRSVERQLLSDPQFRSKIRQCGFELLDVDSMRAALRTGAESATFSDI